MVDVVDAFPFAHQRHPSDLFAFTNTNDYNYSPVTEQESFTAQLWPRINPCLLSLCAFFCACTRMYPQLVLVPVPEQGIPVRKRRLRWSQRSPDEALFERKDEKPGHPSHLRWSLDTSKLALSRNRIHRVCGGGLLQRGSSGQRLAFSGLGGVPTGC